MFNFYFLGSILSTFLIFFHTYVGKEYTFVCGLFIFMALLCHRYENNQSYAQIIFASVLYSIIGSLSLYAYQNRSNIMNQLDQIPWLLLYYFLFFIFVVVIATFVFGFKNIIVKFKERKVSDIKGKNQKIYMTNSVEAYQDKIQEQKNIRRIQNIVDVMVILFITLTTYGVYSLNFITYKFDYVDFSINYQTIVLITICWFTTLFYVFNCWIKQFIIFILIHCIVVFIAMFFAPDYFKTGVFSVANVITVGKTFVYIFAPTIILFFIKEHISSLSFRDC